MRQRSMLDILAEAIMEAARKDEKVKDIIKEILEFDNVDDKTIFTFNARLARFLEDAKDDGCDDDISNDIAVIDDDIPSGMAVIDGHNLSPNEIAFEEHCMNRFNEDEWLADHNLTRPDGKS